MCILFSITLVNRVVRVSQGAARSAWAACGAQAARLNSLWSLWPDMAQVLSASEPFLMNVRECLNFRIHHNVWSETRVRKSKSSTLYATQCPNVLKGCVGMIFHKIPTLQAHTHTKIDKMQQYPVMVSWHRSNGRVWAPIHEACRQKLGFRIKMVQ